MDETGFFRSKIYLFLSGIAICINPEGSYLKLRIINLEMPQVFSSPSRSGLAEKIIHRMHMGFEEKEFNSVSNGFADRKLMRFLPVLRNSYFEIIDLVRTPLGGRDTGNSSHGSDVRRET